jgi:hypothetical protein
MEDWTDLTVSAWVNLTNRRNGMRVVSKDRIGKPGNFMLWYDGSGGWTMQVRDDRRQSWCKATWRTAELQDGAWHHLVGVVDSQRERVCLYVDGELQGEAPWEANSLDDSEGADLVVGADSGETQFGHTFRGQIHDVRLYPRALTPQQVNAPEDNP